MRLLLTLTFIIVAIFSSKTFAQSKNRVQLVQADELVYVKSLGADVQRIRGNAIFKHKTTTMYCDSAYLYGNSNSLKAFGKVHINDNDSIHIYSDSLNYSGNERLATLYNNIRLVDKQMTLTTNYLTYNLSTKVGAYHSGGEIVDQTNKLTSETGIYFAKSKDAFFKDSVVLINPEYSIYCDTMIYNTISERSLFHGPTTILSEENTIYCENGWYNSKTNTSEFSRNAFLKNQNQKISGDKMFYNRNLDFGTARKNVAMTDSANNLTVLSQYAEYRGNELFAMSIDSTVAIIVDESGDTAYLHSDTLIMHFDSLQEARLLLAYHKTQIYKSDLQAICDSLSYSFTDSLIQLYEMPILWSGGSQITGDFIQLFTVGETIDRMEVISNAFILSRDSLDYFNQISGRDMTGFFRDGEFYKLDAYGNAETIYFARDENKELIGVDISIAGDLRIIVENEEIEDIIYFDEPNGTLYPVIELSPNDLKLRGFVNYDKFRPKNKDDIFLWKL